MRFNKDKIVVKDNRHKHNLLEKIEELTRTFFTPQIDEIKEFLDKEHPTKVQRAMFMADVARTSIMMYTATKDERYLVQAKEEIQLGKDILQGFTRPLGSIFT